MEEVLQLNSVTSTRNYSVPSLFVPQEPMSELYTKIVTNERDEVILYQTMVRGRNTELGPHQEDTFTILINDIVRNFHAVPLTHVTFFLARPALTNHDLESGPSREPLALACDFSPLFFFFTFLTDRDLHT
jgi:hypothetical protein